MYFAQLNQGSILNLRCRTNVNQQTLIEWNKLTVNRMFLVVDPNTLPEFRSSNHLIHSDNDSTSRIAKCTIQIRRNL